MAEIENIRVTNTLDTPIRGRFDGKDYVFPPNKHVVLSLEAAAHIFGLGEEDKAPALNKLGFLVPGKEGCTLEDALAKLDKIRFDQGRVTFDDDDESDAEDAPARKRTGGRRPHAGDSGGEPAGAIAPPAGTSGQ